MELYRVANILLGQKRYREEQISLRKPDYRLLGKGSSIVAVERTEVGKLTLDELIARCSGYEELEGGVGEGGTRRYRIR